MISLKRMIIWNVGIVLVQRLYLNWCHPDCSWRPHLMNQSLVNNADFLENHGLSWNMYRWWVIIKAVPLWKCTLLKPLLCFKFNTLSYENVCPQSSFLSNKFPFKGVGTIKVVARNQKGSKKYIILQILSPSNTQEDTKIVFQKSSNPLIITQA